MKRLVLAAATVFALPLTPVQADVIDPLHFSCTACLPDNGTFTPSELWAKVGDGMKG